LIRTVAFAIVTVPVRGNALFAATVKRIVALPTPSAGPTGPIQEASRRALHRQPSVAVKPIDT
jgi:hypothetical protein